AGRPVPNVDRVVVQRLLADRDTDRTPDQVGVRELLAGSLVAVVEEDVLAGRVELGRRLPRLLFEPRQRDDVRVVRRDRGRPENSVLVVVLLDDGGDRARRPDPVTPHHERLLTSVLVEETGPEALRVECSELEDVPDLDRGL